MAVGLTLVVAVIAGAAALPGAQSGPLNNGATGQFVSCQPYPGRGHDSLFAMPVVNEPAGSPIAVLDSITLRTPSDLSLVAAYLAPPADGAAGHAMGLLNGMSVPPTPADGIDSDPDSTWHLRQAFAGTRMIPGTTGMQLGLVVRLTGDGDGVARGFRMYYHIGARHYVSEARFGLLVAGPGRTCEQAGDAADGIDFYSL